jgi:hypothetical protein
MIWLGRMIIRVIRSMCKLKSNRINSLASQRRRRVMSLVHDPNHNQSSGGATYECLYVAPPELVRLG